MWGLNSLAVPVSGGHRDKRLGESAGSILSNLTAKGCWMFENRVFLTKKALGGIIEFSSSEQIPW